MKPYTKKIVMLTLRINPKELKFLNNSARQLNLSRSQYIRNKLFQS